VRLQRRRSVSLKELRVRSWNQANGVRHEGVAFHRLASGTTLKGSQARFLGATTAGRTAAEAGISTSLLLGQVSSYGRTLSIAPPRPRIRGSKRRRAATSRPEPG
jgi:hypothetical protein